MVARIARFVVGWQPNAITSQKGASAEQSADVGDIRMIQNIANM
jgi:hypothetical protein